MMKMKIKNQKNPKVINPSKSRIMQSVKPQKSRRLKEKQLKKQKRQLRRKRKCPPKSLSLSPRL